MFGKPSKKKKDKLYVKPTKLLLNECCAASTKDANDESEN